MDGLHNLVAQGKVLYLVYMFPCEKCSFTIT